MNIHFIGIGGIGMSALATICLSKGFGVSGSDCRESDITRNLISAGATIYIGHKSSNVREDVNTVVYTAAVSPENEEIKSAIEKGIQLLDRAEFLGLLMKEYTNCIAISGTHGKTSTTSMVSVIFQSCNLDPTILVGGNLSCIGGNVRVGQSQNFITEACEYVDSFLKFHPQIAVITNIDADHLDYFKDIEHIKSSFGKFASLVPSNGYVIANGDDENIKDMLSKYSNDIGANILKYGFSDSNDAVIQNVSFDDLGLGSFSLSMDGKEIGPFSLSVPGTHNVLNAAAAIISSIAAGVGDSEITTPLKTYMGVGRRFERKGNLNGVQFIDDYAHHPTEISATLSAAINFCKGRLWCIFQPHTYTRTKLLLDEFSHAFADADNIIVPDIYAAREKDNGDIHAKDLVDMIASNGGNAVYMKSFEDIASHITQNAAPDDMVITMGAGDVYKINDIILK
ncbi:UDP-N-acetylmuramate--L-alanine ligase [Peptoclostridium litorale DSM 5388]|uniref:UDP-N-acetylmuramate--L-alanine ligase n=1 Tax=Peptoclostridium litorale DSM 5388 TaxID=1121324 RepID=A0A069RBV6_PEPLI|nr:UDP-N-acetylmuramate--L-alanine ligase [Peptoclostridium litorale]KDR94248.1 UDP-N-acetylmuramate--L-alanine ligase MurC [Peptoclostridium litorale DSM 5388]SIO28102.1 UDP-N-acetylmuramate--L-alanine ligase [Peptoclostridium litorale DSM 5388]